MSTSFAVISTIVYPSCMILASIIAGNLINNYFIFQLKYYEINIGSVIDKSSPLRRSMLQIYCLLGLSITLLLFGVFTYVVNQNPILIDDYYYSIITVGFSFLFISLSALFIEGPCTYLEGYKVLEWRGKEGKDYYNYL